MPLFIHRTYSEVTPESAEDGDTSDCGFLIENEPMTFRELVDAFDTHREPSCMPARGGIEEWFSSGYEIRDYRTGTERETTIHYGKKNPARMEKYWRKAAQFAGVIPR